MNYEIERKLNEKVDKWEFNSLQSENRELKSQIHELERKITSLENVNSNRYYILERLFSLLAEHEQFSEMQNELYNMRNQL